MLDMLKPTIALYMGGMGAKEQNFHKNVFDRMGYDAITERVQELFLEGKREEATALIPDDLVEEMHIVGDAGYVQGAGRRLGGDRRDHAAAQLPLGRRGAAGRGDGGVTSEGQPGRGSATSWARSCRSAGPTR